MIHTVSVEMTTHCNKRCADCCAGVGINRTLAHHPWEYFVDAAKWLAGTPRIHVTGGEPTTHPQFAEFAPKLRDLFQCKTLTLGTNGYRAQDHEDVIVRSFDYVVFTDYGDRQEALRSLRNRMDVRVCNGSAPFVSRIQNGKGKPCSRACWISHGAAYADGKLWGCCVAPGLSDAVGVVPTESWRTSLPGETLPCSTCFFSE